VQNYANPRLLEQLSLIVGDLILKDGPDQWEPVVAILTNWFGVEEEAQNLAALEVFCNIMGISDNRTHLFIPHIMPHLFPLFTSSRAEVSKRLSYANATPFE
jgi:hypothetical protein